MSIKEYNEVIKECRKFAKKEIQPDVLEQDKEPDSEWVKTIWEKSFDLDLPVLLLPESFGGVGYPLFCGALVLDALASECAGISSVYTNHFTFCLPFLSANDDQKEKHIPSLLNKNGDGPGIGSVIFPSELNEAPLYLSGENGKMFLSGTCEMVNHTPFTDFYCIFVDESNETKEKTCLFVDRNTSGITVGEDKKIPGLKINPFLPVDFNKVEVKPEQIIGKRGSSEELFETTMQAFNGFIAAMAMGTARSAYQKAVSYAKSRYQFGQNIIGHQEIQRMIGNMLMKLNAGTSAYRQLYNDEELDLPFALADPELTKAFCTGVALEIVLDAIQIHGGYGYMHEYGLEKIMRDTKVLELLGKSTPRCHIDVVVRKVG